MGFENARQRNASIELDDASLTAECDVDVYRASGPGGQKRNKTSSAVRLRHRPSGVMAGAVESRSQHENRAKALKRLRQTMALECRFPVDVNSFAPGEVLASCITKDAKLHVGKKDHRMNVVIADLLDLILAVDGRVSEAAEKLGVTTSNLVGLIKSETKMLAQVNELRRKLGAKPLR